jgi:hypothetical protein
MSIQFIFTGTLNKHVMRITSTDWKVAGRLTVSGLKFFPMVSLPSGEVAVHPRKELLISAKAFLEAFKRNQKLLQYYYTFEITPPGMGRRRPSSGSVSGFKINGKYCCIYSGMGECYITEYEVGPDGKGEVVKTVDVRDRKRIKTDDWGYIKIFRRKKKLTWPEVLPPLIEFLKEILDKEICVRVVWRKPSIMDLVRAYERGFGEDDWAEEELEKRGDEAKTALLEILKDPRMSKHYGSIAMLLLTCFPSPESKKAVEQLIEKETDEYAKTIYASLLETMGR